MNSAQREGATTLAGPLLILAGAGTGKTRVITHRIAELIRSGVSPHRILSVTFTNKAAREMAERTSALLGKRRRSKPMICTFHSMCVRVLREEATSLGYPNTFAIYDRGDQESAARTALRDVRVGDKTMRPGDLLQVIGRWKSTGVLPETAAEHVDNDLEFLASVAYRKYQSNLKAAGAVDFDDLLLLTNRLFDEFPAALQRQQQRFDHVQIDEYQDTNGAQFRLVEALVRPHHNLCVVGDDDQSIYGWRGAELRHILGFATIFPGTKTIRLEENYRCTDRILELANRLVRHNRGRHEKALRPNKKSTHDVRFLEFEDEQTEAERVAAEIKFLINRKNVPPADIAILFRTNEQPRPIETELRRQQIPYLLVGGQSFFDRREIRDILAYLKTIAHASDEVSLLRIINTPARGISNATVERVLSRAVREGRPFWDVAPAVAAMSEITPKAAAALSAFRHLLLDFGRRFAEEPRNLPRVTEDLIDTINYSGEIRKQYKNPDQQEAREVIVEQLIESLREYTKRASRPSLAGFLEETALTGRDKESDKEDEFAKNAIKLMTLHSAKGLEFPRVYMVGMEEGFLPHHRSIDADGAAIDEERRLAYVGITRAQDYLTITRAASRMKWGKRRPSPPSRFLHEMRGEDAIDVEQDELGELF